MRIVSFLLSFLPVALFGQTVFFHFTNGAIQSFPVAEIRKLTFVSDEQVLWLSDGTQYTWNVSTIAQFEFEETTGIDHIASGREPLRLHLYPNPTGGEVTIETEMVQGGRLDVEILDMQGRLLRRLYNGDQAAGTYRLNWDTADSNGTRMAPGNYLVRLSTPWGSSTKPLMIH